MTHHDADRERFYENARTDLPGPLAGLRVLEITTTIAGPRCGSILADMGADVVRVELARSPDVGRLIPPMLPDTDPPESFSHASLNRNKRSINLDLRMPEGAEAFRKLARHADVIVENFKKGTLAGWGCGYPQVKEVNPDIIYVSITGFGQYGPYSSRPGYDPGIQAMSGLMWMNAPNDESSPMRVPVYITDELAGMHAALAALAALRHRDATGEGQHVDVSLLDALIDSCTGLHTMAANGLPTPRFGNSVPYATPANCYACKDGHVYAGVLLDSHWKVLARVMGRPELADDTDYNNILSRLGRRKEVEAMMAGWCAERTRDEIIEELTRNGLPAASVLTPAEAVEDPHVKARESIQGVRHPCGTEIKLTAPPAKFSRTPVRLRTAPPILGAHTDEVLGEAGFSEDERKRLRDAGAI